MIKSERGKRENYVYYLSVGCTYPVVLGCGTCLYLSKIDVIVDITMGCAALRAQPAFGPGLNTGRVDLRGTWFTLILPLGGVVF